MTTTTPEATVYELSAGPYNAGELHVTSFDGTEAISALYAFDIVAWCSDVDEGELEARVLGRRATLRMRFGSGAVRAVHGIVSSVAFEGRGEGGRHTLRFSLVPALFRLGKRVNSRIFQDRTVDQIVDQVLDEHRIRRVWSLQAERAPRPYCVQYQESDLQFVRRLLALEGIFFFFEQGTPGESPDPPAPPTDADDGERLVLCDRAEAYGAIDGDPALQYRFQLGDGSMHADEHHVLAFRARARVETGQVVLRDYDYRRPLVDLTAKADGQATLPAAPTEDAGSAAASATGDTEGAGTPLEVYRHHVDFDAPHIDAGRASTYLEALRAEVREAHGESVCRRLLPGHRFELRDHPEGRQNAAHVVTRVRHRGAAGHGASGSTRIYENTFQCVPAEVPFRPAPPEPLHHQVLETGVVVGPPGQEVHTDELGRIKVQFHWN